MNGKKLLLSAMRGEKTMRAAWVPFVGCHGGKLLGVSAQEYLTSEELLVRGLSRAREIYRPDGMPVMFDLQVEAEILGCALRWGDDVPPSVCSHPLAGRIPANPLVAMGELALDGAVRPARAALAAGVVAARRGLPCLLPPDAAVEAAMITGADVRPVGSLAEAIAVAEGGESAPLPKPPDRPGPSVPDLAVVRGQALARRALEVAAAGGHHLLLVGPPGAGKSLLAGTLPGLLPGLTPAERLEVALVWSSGGRPRPSGDRPPFRSPHHTASPAAMLGGGSGMPTPGELSLAHRGVLFLDELGEFPAHLLDGLRQPLETGVVHIARKGISVTFPADVQLVAATNPCPCGFAGDRVRSCTCGSGAVERYRRRLSGPLLDRIDVRVTVTGTERRDLMGPPGEASAVVAERVARAHASQLARGVLNRSLDRDALDRLPMAQRADCLLGKALDGGLVTGRGYDRLRRVARTLADLEGVEEATETHVAEALGLRGSV